MTKPNRRVTLKVLGATLGASAFAYASRPFANWAGEGKCEVRLRAQPLDVHRLPEVRRGLPSREQPRPQDQQQRTSACSRSSRARWTWSAARWTTTTPCPKPGKFYMPVQCQQCDNAPCTQGVPRRGDVEGARRHRGGRLQLVHRLPLLRGRVPVPRAALQLDRPRSRGRDQPGPGVLSNRIRPQGVVEKCTFCLHRTREGRCPRASRPARPAHASSATCSIPTARSAGCSTTSGLRPQGGARDTPALLLLLRRVSAMADPMNRSSSATAHAPTSSPPALSYRVSTSGSRGSRHRGHVAFYAWMTILLTRALVGAQRVGQQVAHGMARHRA
jgi:hypothetical protein